MIKCEICGKLFQDPRGGICWRCSAIACGDCNVKYIEPSGVHTRQTVCIPCVHEHQLERTMQGRGVEHSVFLRSGRCANRAVRPWPELKLDFIEPG